MLQQETAADYVIATGETHTLESFVSTAFAFYGLDWKRHVDQDPALFRPTDLSISLADPSSAAKKLGWKAKFRIDDAISGMAKEFQEKPIEQLAD